jgi:hypothetical protein
MDRTRIVAAVTTTLSSMFLLLPIVFPPSCMSSQCPVASHHVNIVWLPSLERDKLSIASLIRAAVHTLVQCDHQTYFLSAYFAPTRKRDLRDGIYNRILHSARAHPHAPPCARGLGATDDRSRPLARRSSTMSTSRQRPASGLAEAYVQYTVIVLGVALHAADGIGIIWSTWSTLGLEAATSLATRAQDKICIGGRCSCTCAHWPRSPCS